ncbi:MAG TPA: DUF92 domain-containing protein [Ignavibacteriales bacterium]|nr:DUF92 domain-containing protein [Ignavibacteriales bacterium]HOL80611.1 DUF92 domain-containing protein [Ignavibacteriales bacterium]HOM64299.1 DUF92 domain-containing protein [Ignavibacteriales bacterium]HPD68041.1 DUF92 domain-containing protein [Ignavibacteriales bacterium]HPP33055.1 DUF92 domain-containing protein [Ignavibacteriales bacterium]
MTINDIKYAFTYIAAISVIIKILDYFAKKYKVSTIITRKILHIIACVMIAYSPYLIQNYYLNLSLFFIVFVIVTVLNFKNFFSSFTLNDKNYGIVFLPIAYVISYLIVGEENKLIITTAFLILGFSDGLSGLIGTLYANKFYKITKDTKSYLGSTIFLLSTILILYLQLKDIIIDNQYLRISVLLLAYLLTAIEAGSSYGVDNLFIPFVSIFMLDKILNQPNLEDIYFLQISFFIATLAGYLSYKVKFLKKDGAFGAFILAFFLLGFGGIKWVVPILTFFILSSLFSKIRKKINSSVDTKFEKSDVRDIFQVFANGGLSLPLLLLYLITGSEILYYSYIIFLAAATADTWGTEIGTMFKTNTYSIIGFKKIHQGVSGGVSIIGTFGAFIGASVTTISAIFWIENFNAIVLIILLGFLGSIIDSILGYTLQRQNQCTSCGKITESLLHCGIPTNYHKGIKWLNNDSVNFISNFVVSMIIFLII